MGIWAGASDTTAKYVHSGQTEIAVTGQSRTAQAPALPLAVFILVCFSADLWMPKANEGMCVCKCLTTPALAQASPLAP